MLKESLPIKEIVLNVTGHLTNPDHFDDAWNKRYLNDKNTNIKAAQGYVGLGAGVSGIALTLFEANNALALPDYEITAHKYLERAANSLSELPEDVSFKHGMASGLAGFGFALAYMSKDGSRYQNALQKIDDALFPYILGITQAVATPSFSLTPALFDQISGLSGMVPYLLLRQTEKSKELLERICKALIGRCIAGIATTQGFIITPDNQPTARHRESYPSGCVDLGMAHGVAGVLSALSLAYRSGAHFLKHEEALSELAGYLIKQAHPTENGLWWEAVTQPENADQKPTPSRLAWCYGTLGITKALDEVSQALNEASFSEVAGEGVRYLTNMPLEETKLIAPTFCHGAAGVLSVMDNLSADTLGDQAITVVNFKDDLKQFIFSTYKPESMFGFQDWVEDESGFIFDDRAGILDGASGVALALMNNLSPSQGWEKAFLI